MNLHWHKHQSIVPAAPRNNLAPLGALVNVINDALLVRSEVLARTRWTLVQLVLVFQSYRIRHTERISGS